MTESAFRPTPEMIEAVEEWHQRRPEERVRRALVPVLRDRFHLTVTQAVEVIRQSHVGGANAA
ncbi:hypothetical protein DPM33_15080 [Mesorhizobium hawassense]|uniref:Uncharacterized protein n=1 Tax=Mesorhizobium hawassense TaxID=1209954 RepID=A0A330HU72_9HYPH|nr:hypothetical protein [Mesorhizobium hawassense]RAZ90149.1 hypothetical protein DPM33_15080 [Mesorhizobium hawassense]